MKIKKIIKSEEEVEISLPAFRKNGHNVYKIVSEELCINVWLLGESFAISTAHRPPDVVHYDEATEEEFEEALHVAVSRAAQLSQHYHWKTPEKISEVEKSLDGKYFVGADPIPQKNQDL